MKKIKSKLKILIPVILAVTLILLCIPVSASAETIDIKPTYSNISLNYLSGEIGFPFSLTNILEDQYTYGGLYNPLIMQGSSTKWQTALCSVRWNFGKTLSAGTVLSLQCGGWHHKAYAVEDKFMYASLTPPTNDANLNSWISERQALTTNSVGYVQTANGVYHGYLFSGTYTLPADSSYIYLVFQLNLSNQRNSNIAVGQHCNSIRYEANHVSPAESEIYSNPDTSAIDEYESQESQVLEGIDGGLTQSKNMFQNFLNTFTPFIQGTMFMSNVIAFIINGNNNINSLVTISLSLGIFGLLTNILAQSLKKPRDHVDKKGRDK